MASYNDTKFAAFAGQEVQGGIRNTPRDSPVVPFGQHTDENTLANLSKINGLIPKIGKTIIHETAIYTPEILKIFKRDSMQYGAAVEDFAFMNTPKNRKSDGTCVPRQTDTGASQLSLANLSFKRTVNIYDKEVNHGLLSDSEVSQYIAQKMRLLESSYMELQMAAAIQLISGATAGKRSISSYTSSDGTGSAVTYAIQTMGWAGAVKNHDDWVINEISNVSAPVGLEDQRQGGSKLDMVLDFLNEVKSSVTGMRYSGTSLNKLGINTHSKQIHVVMESGVLDAFDRVIQDAGANYYEGATARGYIGALAGVDLVEVPAFSALPAYDSTITGSTDYTGQRLAAAIVDADMPGIIEHDYSMEAMRCGGERMTAYDMQAEQTWRMWTGANGIAILVDADASDDVVVSS